MAAHTAHLEIDLRFDADGIRGEVCRDAGPPRLFSGWLGLIGALDGLLNDDTDEGVVMNPARPTRGLDLKAQDEASIANAIYQGVR